LRSNLTPTTTSSSWIRWKGLEHDRSWISTQEFFKRARSRAGLPGAFAVPGESVAPMVLVGRSYWTRTLPAWPLLQTLARGRAMERYVHLVDNVDEAAELVQG
jgi:hypothetical protein